MPPSARGHPQEENARQTPRGISGYWNMFREGYDEVRDCQAIDWMHRLIRGRHAMLVREALMSSGDALLLTFFFVSQLVKAIIRPPRAEYDILELGPDRFEYGGVLHLREDSSFTNARGLKLQCSMWRRADLDAPAPCVVYSHGNASCRAEALQILAPVLASGASVFAFDFAGCGQSEGEYISLGWYEKDDLQACIENLRSSGLVSAIMLWGRSMGAVSAVFQAARDPSLAGVILDSPFASLEQVALELVTSAPETVQGAPSVPPFLVKTALHVVAGSVKKRVSRADNPRGSSCPALLCSLTPFSSFPHTHTHTHARTHTHTHTHTHTQTHTGAAQAQDHTQPPGI